MKNTQPIDEQLACLLKVSDELDAKIEAEQNIRKKIELVDKHIEILTEIRTIIRDEPGQNLNQQ